MNPLKNLCRSLTTLFDLALVLIILALLIMASSVKANFVTLINGNSYTNFNASVGAGVNTNSSGILTNNVQLGVILAGNTNVFTMSGSIGTQDATNHWPSIGFSTEPTQYPFTLNGPFNNVSWWEQFNLSSTNTAQGSTSIQVHWAQSDDNVHWQSNAIVQTFLFNTNVTVYGPFMTNFTTGARNYYCIHEIDNTNLVDVTNLVITVNGKAGL